jgi:uncharacterized membrane protein
LKTLAVRLKEKIIEKKEELPIIGLGIFMLAAGISKFLILQYWTGYEPQILVNALPLTAETMTLLGGVFEALLGLWLLTQKKTFYASSITTLWLLAITIQVSRLGLWDLAIRDLGLTLYALSVAVNRRS